MVGITEYGADPAATTPELRGYHAKWVALLLETAKNNPNLVEVSFWRWVRLDL